MAIEKSSPGKSGEKSSKPSPGSAALGKPAPAAPPPPPPAAIAPPVATPAPAATPVVQSDPLSLNGVRYVPSSFNQQEIEAAAASRSKSAPVIEPVRGDTDQYLSPTDVCAVALICPSHRKIAVTEMSGLLEASSSSPNSLTGGNNGYWLPWAPFDMRKDILEPKLNELIPKFIDMHKFKFRNPLFCAHDRLQVPKTGRYITRYFHRVEIIPKAKSSHECICLAQSQQQSPAGKQASKLYPVFWLTNTELAEPQVVASLAGPEPKTVIEQYLEDLEASRLAGSASGGRGSRGQPHKQSVPSQTKTVQQRKWSNLERFGAEYAVEDVTSAFVESAGRQHQLMVCCGLGRAEVLSLYNEYVFHCFPSIAMGQFSLGRFLAEKLAVGGMSSTEADDGAAAKVAKYFRIFDQNRQSFLSFADLLPGLAICRANWHKSDRLSCGHAVCDQAKRGVIFRSYIGSATSHRLSSADLALMLLDLEGKSHSEANVAAAIKSMPALPGSLTFEQFQALLKSGSSGARFSKLFSLLVPLHQDFSLKAITVKKFTIEGNANTSNTQKLVEARWSAPQPSPPSSSAAEVATGGCCLEEPSTGRCNICSRTRYAISMHLITLTQIGEISDISKLEADANHIPPTAFRADIHETDIHVVANDLVDKIKRFGMFKFTEEGGAAMSSGTGGTSSQELARQLENLFYPSKAEAIRFMTMVVNKAEELFAGEARCLSLASPCFVLGDIHGNLKDLLSHGSNLWRQSPFVNHSRYLFLGDYVDRGAYGVECVILLFCLKILAPANFFLLRGNHEVRETQESFSFHRECIARFNADLWESINLAFDRLPVAAVVDGVVYAAHGGIPASVNSLQQIRAIHTPLDLPQLQSAEAWEILWNDPTSEAEYRALSDFDRSFALDSSGFVRNTKRGTAFQYTEQSVLQFLRRNALEFVVRAHEMYDEGYYFHHRGHVITVFSCSKYINNPNRASVLYLDGHAIHVVQMTTDD